MAVHAAAPQEYYASTANQAEALIIDVASRVQTGSALRMDMSVLSKSPARLSGLEIYWADGVLEVECLEHQTRIKMLAGLTLDRGRRLDDPNPAFHVWSDNAPGSPARALEEFVCRGHPDSDLKPLASLTEFASAFEGGAATAQANSRPPTSGGPPPAPSPQGAVAPAGLAPYYRFGGVPDSAELHDIAGVKRTGPYAFTTLITLRLKPYTMGGTDFYWVEYTEEFDCEGHRFRNDATFSLLTLDRSQAFNSADKAKLGAWGPDKPETNGRAVEDLVCRGKVEEGEIGVYDLTAFQRQFFASMRQQPVR